MRKTIIIWIFFNIYVLGIMALKDSMPSPKMKRVYTILQKHIPYTLEKELEDIQLLVMKQV